jgi:hypothetical protein
MDRMKGQSKKRCGTTTLTSFFSLASTPVISLAPSILFPTIDEEMADEDED